MSIQIDEVRILGFRGIKSLEVELSKVTVLVGTNNSGKTSFLKALHLVLGDYSRHLSDEDFYIGKDDQRVNEIRVDVRIVPMNDGQRVNTFNEEWATEFGDTIKAEANGQQYVAIRSRSKPNSIRGGFETNRFTLEKWPDAGAWEAEKVKETKLTTRFQSIPFIFNDAQRDIHQELKEKSSFVGKVLSSVEYSQKEIEELEELIKKVNDESVAKSQHLEALKKQLESLNQSFQGAGVAEITPFPKKIRDLSKHFTVHFGEDTSTAFSMEYHGMGTRSWASMLTAKAFVEMMSDKHEEEVEPFFPLFAAEEPEAHLHPSAQKTLYRQLSETTGQVIVSTHSPYLVAMVEQSELRHLKSTADNVEVCSLSSDLSDEDRRRLHREVIHSRGEIVFSKAIVLCEGETEEQALPLLFEKYFSAEAFSLGVNFIGVGGSGKKYHPFLTFAHDFKIPVFIFSDGEGSTVKQLKKNYEKVFGETDLDTCSNITILDDTDFEGYLISSGFKPSIEAAIEGAEGEGFIESWISKRDGTSKGRTKTDEPPCTECKQPIYADVPRDYQVEGGYEKALLDILDSSKAKFSPAVASELCKLGVDDLPPKLVEFYEKIKAGLEID
ncbi:ATP-dependent nuclease [Neptuniibacter sp. QD48_11]|uniref:ATP-dependent nuclease n=1 Tax=Neptuniibacter sp. QD48_11 TaxID=3398211 RepID=UPI0039F4680F